MKSNSISIRSIFFPVLLVLILSGVSAVPAFTSPVETQKEEVTTTNRGPEGYIVYVQIEHVRWAQVYNSEGNLIDFDADPES